MVFGPDDPVSRLAARFMRGDVAAFEALFRALHAPLCEVVDSYVRSQSLAEDIVQDLFLAIWTRRESLPAARKFRPYLFAAARNRALNHLRHGAIVRRWSLWADSRPAVAGVAEAALGPDDALEASERRDALRLAVDQLPTRARLALVLQMDHQMSHAEVSAAMGISIKGVEKLLATAKSRLRTLLERHAPER